MTQVTVATDKGVLVARSRNGEWKRAEYLDGSDVQALAADPLRPAIIYCGTYGQGLWRSDDAGDNWRPVGEGITEPQVMSVAVSAHERSGGDGVVYVGTEPSALFRSINGGATWQECAALRALPSAPTWSFPPRPYTSHVRCITLDPHTPGILSLCIEAGALVRSMDGGETWRDRVPTGPYDTHTLLAHADAPGRLYAAAGDGFMRPGTGYAESDDAGASWRHIGEGLPHQYLWGAAVDPGDPDTVVVSAARSPNQAHNPTTAESFVYRRSGDGWQAGGDGLPVGAGMLAAVLATNGAEPGIFYAAANTGLYRSADGGRSWSSLPVAWPDSYRSRHINALVITESAR
ncbi:MAG: glycosyl hydrolase [Chloroflexota bacterium]|nr:glycosyl hydrolase [Chloroflexota bacterium]MDQ6905929.1 glycosyl hydrolase [Chloroflexota bacterium]